MSRKIGQASVSSVGFGAMGLTMSQAYGPVGSEEEQFKVLDYAYDHGCRFWDTADVYTGSEELIGKWFKRTGKRNDMFLATKFGMTGLTTSDGSAKYTKEAAERSLKKLGVETIDLFYFHRMDVNTPIEITVGGMAELVKEGKVRYLGLSECSSETLRRAHAVHPISAIQVEYSPFLLDIESPKIGLLKTARELGVTIVAYSPLGRGLLSGNIKSQDDLAPNDFRRTIPKYSNENFPKILEIANRIKSIGDKYNATASQVTLAWILAQGDDFIPIPGTKKIKYLEENLKASSIELSAEDIQELRAIAVEGQTIAGDRYGLGMQESLFLDTPPLPASK